MTQRRADWILTSISIAWGSSNLMLRLGLEGIETFNLIALRFGLAFFIVVFIFRKKMKDISLNVLFYSALLGFIVYSNFTVLIWALQHSTVSEVGFLTSTSVVFVPIICSILRRKLPDKNVLLAMIVVLIGLALMNLEDGITLSVGTLLSLLAALVNALALILTDYASHHADNALQLGVLQIGFTGLFGLITSLIFETPKLPQTKVQWFAVLVLAVVCSAYGYVMRPLAQKYTTPERAGFLLILEPVFSALFGFLVLHEMLRPSSYLGAVLVLISLPIANGFISNQWKRLLLSQSSNRTKE